MSGLSNWWVSLPIMSGSYGFTPNGVHLGVSGFVYGYDDGKDYDLGIDGKEPSIKFIKNDGESNDKKNESLEQ